MVNYELSKTDDGMVVSQPKQEEEKAAAEKVVTEFVQGTDGSVMLAARAEKEKEQDFTNAISSAKTDSGAVISMPEAEEEMTEVSWDEMNKQAIAIQEEAKEAINSLVGQFKSSVEEFLSKMVEDAKIGSFRFLDPGQGATADYVPDRVQVFTDKDDVVRNIVVG